MVRVAAQGGICGVCDQPETLPIFDRDLRAYVCAPCAEHLVAAQRAVDGHVITHLRSITPSA